MDSLSFEELYGWAVWLNAEPHGELRDDQRSGLQTAFLRQASGFIEAAEDPNDFVLKFETQEQVAPEVAAVIDELFAAPTAFVSFFNDGP